MDTLPHIEASMAWPAREDFLVPGGSPPRRATRSRSPRNLVGSNVMFDRQPAIRVI
jgi:hypothetical protein